MTIAKIVVITALIVIAGIIGCFFVLRYISNKNAPKFSVLGTVVGWQNAKIPLLGRAIIQYSKRGKPMQVQSGLLLTRNKPKMGMKQMWEVSIYRMPNKAVIYIANKKKR